jgi:hypothetical protein
MDARRGQDRPGRRTAAGDGLSLMLPLPLSLLLLSSSAASVAAAGLKRVALHARRGQSASAWYKGPLGRCLPPWFSASSRLVCDHARDVLVGQGAA